MLREDTFSFAKAVSDLWLMEEVCLWSRRGQMEPGQIADTRTQILAVADQLVGVCQPSGIERRLGPDIDRFKIAVESDHLADVARSCSNLRDRLLDELQGELYLHVPMDDRAYFGVCSPFGVAVTRKFTKSADDFARAADCLALQQPTASVFHLMRGVEAAVRRLARKLNTTVTPGSTWRQITTAMDARITAMPHQTTKEHRSKEEWKDARINLDILGSVIRNETMHAASAYTQVEARHIFGIVREVMTRLCRL